MKSAQQKCAIYTRKSTERGLEQEFNTLDAQREACLAYITSQKSEGWTPVKHLYDDGGYSGGSMDRPALNLLLEDIRAGKINIVVVYKIERLTRSLTDFAKLVDVFDRRGVSFVSVTQSFNTTTYHGGFGWSRNAPLNGAWRKRHKGRRISRNPQGCGVPIGPELVTGCREAASCSALCLRASGGNA